MPLQKSTLCCKRPSPSRQLFSMTLERVIKNYYANVRLELKMSKNATHLMDKPWEKYYVSPPESLEQIADMTLYEAYVKANSDHLDELAMISMDTKNRYTHREIVRMVDLAAAGFSEMGIKDSDRVGILLNNTVEDAVCLLALNKIGAVSFFADFSKGIADIAHSIAACGVKLLLIDESMLPMEPYINSGDLPLIIVGQTKPFEKGIPFIELYGKGQGKDIPAAPFTKGKPSVIINSSGTTGNPKPIVHTDRSINSAVYKILCSDYSMTRGNVLLKTIPSFIGLGLITSLYSALISGATIFLVAGNNPQQSIVDTVSFISNYPMYREWAGIDPSAKLLVYAAPMHYRVLCENLGLCKDLSYIGAMLAAGAKMGKNELEKMDKQLAELHCPVKVCNGYGQNEMAGAVTLNTNRANKNGSAGFPVVGTNVCVVDPESLEILGQNQCGLILEQSESAFLAYDNMPEETKDSTITLADGSVWFNTKDLGEMDEDGFLWITGRISRVLVRFDCKISIDKIEEKIKAHKAVLDCAVIAVYKDETGEEPIAYVSLKEQDKDYDAAKLIDEIQSGADPLSYMEYPSKVLVVPSLPYMKNGKVDYRQLNLLYEKSQSGQ